MKDHAAQLSTKGTHSNSGSGHNFNNKVCDRLNKEARLNKGMPAEKNKSTGALNDDSTKKRKKNLHSPEDSASTDVDAGEELERLKN